MAEPLTIAYVAIGARIALTITRDANPRISLDRFNGEMGYVAQVASWSDHLDKLAEGRDLDGLFAYEVAEAFGETFGARLLFGKFPETWRTTSPTT